MIRLVRMWARRHKHGRLRSLLQVYRWFRFNVLPRLYQGLILLRPHSVALYGTLASVTEEKYAWMITRRKQNVEQVTGVRRLATTCFEEILARDPECLEAYSSLSLLLADSDKFAEAMSVAQRGFVMQHTLAERHQLEKIGVRFISPFVATGPLGVLGNLDAYVKAGVLGMRAQVRSILLVRPGHRIPNPHLLNYWSEYITVISDPRTVERLLPFVRYLEDPVDMFCPCKGKLLYFPSAATLVFRQWEQERRSPLLRLSEADRKRGEDRLRQMGMPDGAWFVCAHVRGAGFKDGDGIQDLFRNANVDTYFPMFEEIAARGGWVVRMGNPTMEALPAMKQVVDYAHSGLRSDWMDVFLCAQSRFFMDTSSGPHLTARAFGTPCALTNFLPSLVVAFSSQDIFIPKLCWSEDLQRHLTFSELMSPPVNTFVHQHRFDRSGLTPVDNTAEEIRDLAVEMLDRCNGAVHYTEGAEELQSRFKDMTATIGTLPGLEDIPLNCRIGRDFLDKYAGLLP